MTRRPLPPTPVRTGLLLALPWILAGCGDRSSPTAPELEPIPVTWIHSEHVLGRGTLRPENVESLDPLRLTAPAGTSDGAEVHSRRVFGAGRYTARLDCPDHAGILCALFLYQQGVGDQADEIDVEIMPERREIAFTVWKAGRRVFHRTRAWEPGAPVDVVIRRGVARISFELDGEVVASFSGPEVPTEDLPLYASIWWPVWLSGTRSAETAVFEVTDVVVAPDAPSTHDVG